MFKCQVFRCLGVQVFRFRCLLLRVLGFLGFVVGCNFWVWLDKNCFLIGIDSHLFRVLLLRRLRLSPSLFAHVDVAVFLRPMATIGHRVPELGSWGDEGSQWKAPSVAFAVKGEPVSLST